MELSEPNSGGLRSPSGVKQLAKIITSLKKQLNDGMMKYETMMKHYKNLKSTSEKAAEDYEAVIMKKLGVINE